MKARQWVLLALPFLIVLATVVSPTSADPSKPVPAAGPAKPAATAVVAVPQVSGPPSECTQSLFTPAETNASPVPGTDPGNQFTPVACPVRCVAQADFCAGVPLHTPCGIHPNCGKCEVCNGMIDCFKQ